MIYVVQSGDTLNEIARRFNTSVSAIMSANGLTSTELRVGQRLFIPVGTGFPPTTPPTFPGYPGFPGFPGYPPGPFPPPTPQPTNLAERVIQLERRMTQTERRLTRIEQQLNIRT